SIRSGAVSTSVPSRSKTMVDEEVIMKRYRSPCDRARWVGYRTAWPGIHEKGAIGLFSAIPDVKSTLERGPNFSGAGAFVTMDELKRQAAARALEEVREGMKLGLGTGSTAKHFVDLLGERVRAGLRVVGVPTSEATRAQAERCGIALTTLDDVDSLDLTVDGADECDGALNLIKGGGGALLREKIVAASSDRMIVIADETKWVDTLGRFPLPVEVIPFGLAATQRGIAKAFAQAGVSGQMAVRKAKDGHVFVTDG